MPPCRLALVALLAASASQAATPTDKLVAMRAKLAASGVLGRSSGWKSEVRFATTQAKDPQLAAQVLYDVARAQRRSSTKYAVPTLKLLLDAKYAKAQPWATLAAYELAAILAAGTETRQQAIDLYKKYLASKHRDPLHAAEATLALATLHYNGAERDEALALCRSFLDRFPGHDTLRAMAHYHMGKIAIDQKQFDQAEAAYDKLAAEHPWDLAHRSALLYALSQAYRTAEKREDAVRACQRYLDDCPGNSYERPQVYLALGQLHAQLKNSEGVAATYHRMAEDRALRGEDRARAHQYLLSFYGKAGKRPELIHEAYQLITLQPRTVAAYSSYLSSLVDALIETERFDEGVAMARAAFRISQIPLDPARRSRSSSRSGNGQGAILNVVQALKAKEGGLRTANAFITFLTTGPEGPDGRLGTKDDVADPLAAYALPAEPERDKLFGAAVKRLATDPLDQALVYLFWDKPAHALRSFRRHYLQATTATGLRTAITILAQAMRAVGRPEAEVQAFFDFQNYGPNGKDGKPRTKDDLKDPILKLR